MTLNFGSSAINKFWLGTTEVKKAHLGSALVYDKTAGVGPVFDTYGLAANPSSSTITLGGIGGFTFIDGETSAICLHSGLGSSQYVTGMTIGGRTAVRTDEYTGEGVHSEMSIWVPSTNGVFTTSDVVITHTAQPFRTIAANLNIGNRSRNTGNNDGAADPLSMNISPPEGAVVVGMGFINDAAYTPGDAVGTGFSSKVLDIQIEGDRALCVFLQTSALGNAPETYEIDSGAALNMNGGAVTAFA